MSTKKKPVQRLLSRRETLGLLGAAGIAAVMGCGDDSTSPSATGTPRSPATVGGSPTGTANATATAAPLSCVATPALTEGPYFVDEMLNRSDIRSDPATGSVSEGVPLRMQLTVSQVNGSACTALSGAAVDVWHCDSQGVYSDVASGAGQASTKGQKFLRGCQLTDDNGLAEFTTVYPGWYMGRTVHIHIKVRTQPGSQEGHELTTQLFMDDAVTDQVYALAPYSSRGSRDTRNASDGIYQQSAGQLLLPLTTEGDGYLGRFHLGLRIT